MHVLVGENNITFGWTNNTLGFVLSLVFILVCYALLFFIFARVIKRKSGYFILSISLVGVLFGLVFDLLPVIIVVSGLSAAFIAVTLFANLGDLRTFIASPFKRTSAKAANFGIEKIYDRQALYKEIEKATLHLSKTRTGALMTFERNTSLKEIMKNGCFLHAPVNAELLETIFYTGTRLHDGAVVIHGNEIVAASVFFTPTTKPFAGKYGSRHRAAIGISEVSDSVTVVVSEETGRISIATNGQLEMIEPNNFFRAFETYMADNLGEEE